MRKNETSIGIVHMKIEVGEKILLIPRRVCIGKFDEDNNLFYDIISNSVLGNARDSVDFDISESFGEVRSLKLLEKLYKTKDKAKIIKSFMRDKKKYITSVFYNDEDDIEVELVTPEELAEKDKIVVKYMSREDLPDMFLLLRQERDMFLQGLMAYEEENEETEELTVGSEQKKQEVLKISELCKELRSEIISQDEAIKKIVTAVFKNLVFNDPDMKSNILIYGPTGVGKTQILKSLSKKLSIPLWIEDMTKFTEAGYKGGDVEDILWNLYTNAGNNLELAERSILVLDEIDKKAGNNGDSDVSRASVLKSLLSIIEGGKFELSTRRGSITFDTSNLTVIACGAFTDLRNDLESKSKTIGFGEKSEETKENRTITIKDFEKYGMPLEFMGRFKTIIKMNSLGKEDFIKILKDSTISPIAKYQKALARFGVDTNFDDRIYELIASKALTYNTGARALSIVVDSIFEDTLYDIFDSPENIEDIELNVTKNENDEFSLIMKRKKEGKVGEGSV